jgi:hypothetical protein
VFRLHIGQHVLVLGSDDLLAPQRFKKRFVECLRWIPKLPGKKSTMRWDDYVNLWLNQAEVLEQPTEASTLGLLKQLAMEVIDGLSDADDLGEVRRGRSIQINGRRGFLTLTVLNALHEHMPHVGSHQLCDILRELGCENQARYIGGKSVRLWLAPAVWPDDDSLSDARA